MTAAPGTDPLGTIPLFDVKIPLTPARATAALRAPAALGASPAQRREPGAGEHQLITGARTTGTTRQQIAARLGRKDCQSTQHHQTLPRALKSPSRTRTQQL